MLFVRPPAAAVPGNGDIELGMPPALFDRESGPAYLSTLVKFKAGTATLGFVLALLLEPRVSSLASL